MEWRHKATVENRIGIVEAGRNGGQLDEWWGGKHRQTGAVEEINKLNIKHSLVFSLLMYYYVIII